MSEKKLTDKNKKIKGKIIRGAAFSSLFKTNISSIPSKTENFLLPENVHNKILDGFISHSERFDSSKNSNPGVGDYNLGSHSRHTYYHSFSSKGYGNGFLSKLPKLNVDNNLSPGPGDYNTGEIYSIKYSTEKSLIGKSLYSNQSTTKNKKNLSLPGPATYSPSKFDNWKLNSKKFTYNFDSFSKRKDFLDKEKVSLPGPGQYFTDSNLKKNKKISSSNEETKNRDNLYYSKDILNKFKIRTSQRKSDINYKLCNGKRSDELQKSHIYTSKENSLTIHQNSNNSMDIEEKSPEREKTSYENTTEPIEEEVEYCNTKPFRRKIYQKPDIFSLFSPRWKENKYELKVPGPAYYITKDHKMKYSYNRNGKEFICPGGPEMRE